MNDDKCRLKIIQNAVEAYCQEHEVGGSGNGFAITLLSGKESQFRYCRGSKIDFSTAFPLASLSKPFLAALALQSSMEGELNLESDIKQYFPMLKTDRPITIADLLNQTSGIAEYLYAATPSQLNRWSLEEYCDFIQTLPTSEQNNYAYSNSNFVLLTRILEISQRQPYYSQLSSALFFPLRMHDTFSFEEIVQKGRQIAMPHYWQSGRWIEQPLERLCMGYGDSSLFSSLQDMETWLGSSRFKNYVRAIEKKLPSPLSKYNSGLFCEIVDGSLVFSHSGSMPGALSLIVHIPDRDISLVYLSNYSPLHFEPLLVKLMDAFGLT